MNRILLVLSAVLLSAQADAQNWRAIGRGTTGPTSVQTLYGDTVSDRLLAGGTFLDILNAEDTVLGVGQAAWNGTRWDSLATRVQPIAGSDAQQTYWYLRFQGALYACGAFYFQTADSIWNNSIARLNEENQRWEALECINPDFGGMMTLVPKEPQGTLYATGYKGSVCGYPESCVFRYDGSAFHVWEPFNQIPEGNDTYVGTVFDFQGKTYMTGLMRDPLGPGYVSFLRFNGATWEHVPGWNTLSPIKDISIHNNILYVAGTFRMDEGAPGNLVASFDAENWNDLGGGLLYTPVPMSSVVYDLEWFHEELWTCGRFNLAAGVPAHSIAKWNGHQWCMPPGDIQWHSNALSLLTDMAVWRDSLYVCGGIATIDGEPFGQVAQWIGGDAVEECSADVGIVEHGSASEQGFSIVNISTRGWAVQFPHGGEWILEVYDATGRMLSGEKTNGMQTMLDLAGQSTGVYLLRATNVEGEMLSAKILRP